MIKNLFSQGKSRIASRHGESGQAIILIALAAVGLIAVMGLSIDGGRLFVLQREAQQSADAAALAGARAACLGNTNYEQIAKDAAMENGFTEEQVEVNSPPENSNIAISEQCVGCFLEVVVNAQIPGTFISMFYKDPLAVSSASIAVCDPYMFDTDGDGKEDFINNAANPPGLRALWALGTGKNACGINVTGSVSEISGGYHSNWSTKISGSLSTVIGPASWVWTKDASGHNEPSDGKVQYVTGGQVPALPSQTILGACGEQCFKCQADTTLGQGQCGCNNACVPGSYPWANPYHICTPAADPMALKITDYAPSGPKAVAAGKDFYHSYTADCGGVEDWFESYMASDGTIQPGLYYTTCPLHFPSNFDFHGTATIVTASDIQFSGAVDLTAWQDNLVLFAAGGSSTCTSNGSIKISGNNNTYRGNMYAPAGEIKLSGAQNLVEGCVVGWGVSFSGSNSKIECDPTFSVVTNNPGIWLAQ